MKISISIALLVAYCKYVLTYCLGTQLSHAEETLDLAGTVDRLRIPLERLRQR